VLGALRRREIADDNILARAAAAMKLGDGEPIIIRFAEWTHLMPRRIFVELASYPMPFDTYVEMVVNNPGRALRAWSGLRISIYKYSIPDWRETKIFKETFTRVEINDPADRSDVDLTTRSTRLLMFETICWGGAEPLLEFIRDSWIVPELIKAALTPAFAALLVNCAIDRGDCNAIMVMVLIMKFHGVQFIKDKKLMRQPGSSPRPEVNEAIGYYFRGNFYGYDQFIAMMDQ